MPVKRAICLLSVLILLLTIPLTFHAEPSLKSDTTVAVSEKAGKKPTSLKLNKTKLTLQLGKSYTLKVTLKPSNAKTKVVWEAYGDSVSVNIKNPMKAKLKAVRLGKTVLYASSASGDVEAKCVVNVIPVQVSSVKMNKTKATAYISRYLTLKATVKPSNAQNKRLVWKSSKPSIAKVDANGVVTPLKPGKTKITATAHNGKKATTQLTVKLASARKTAATAE